MILSWIVRIWGEGGVRLLVGDAIVVIFLTSLGVGLLVKAGDVRGRATVAEIQAGGRTVITADRAEEGLREVSGPLGTTRVEFRDGRVRILSSPCPLKICQRAGWIEAAGQMLVCLPNEVVVRFPGRRADGTDAVSR